VDGTLTVPAHHRTAMTIPGSGRSFSPVSSGA
jgi:hypothetical protein